MYRILPWLMAFSFVAAAAQAQSSAQQVSATPASPASVDSVINNFRAEMQKSRADIMAKNLTLTADQAAKFWPAYSKFQAEQATIVDAQLAAMQKYVTSFGSIDDAKALEYTNANLARDQQMFELRSKWLKEFQKILPARIAARVIQIDRRLGIAHQLFLSSQLPLIY